ncbi:MAG: hypothetical protein ACOX4R_01095 [Lentihominibacter sp.]|jgi:hypothetical protein
MNYGKKLKFILIAGGGMFIAITGISFKTGYIPGHSDFSAYILLVLGTFFTIFGLIQLSKYK